MHLILVYQPFQCMKEGNVYLGIILKYEFPYIIKSLYTKFFLVKYSQNVSEGENMKAYGSTFAEREAYSKGFFVLVRRKDCGKPVKLSD